MLNVKAAGHLASFSFDYQLELPSVPMHALMGASGSGKSTLLSIVSGGIRLKGAQVEWRQHIWQRAPQFVPAHKRSCVWVDQKGSLWPHLKVKEQLAFAYKRAVRKLPSSLHEELPEAFGIAPLMDRSVHDLSGGEVQRVALLRAWMAYPELLLLDEPLSALDTSARFELGETCRRLAQSLEVNVLWVSHGEGEVARIADTMSWIEAGRIKETGNASEVLSQYGQQDQNTAFTVIEGEVEKRDHYGILHLRVGDEILKLSSDQNVELKTVLRCICHSKDISLSRVKPEQTSVMNQFLMGIEDIDTSADGMSANISLRSESLFLQARITRYSVDHLSLVKGDRVWAQIKALSVMN